MTTIKLHNKTEIKAHGKHTKKNSQLTLCITTGEVFASMLDAAEKANVAPSCITRAIQNVDKGATCKGKRYCRVNDAIFYLDEISQNISERESKAAAWDAQMAEERAAREAEELRQKKMNAATARISNLERELEEIRVRQNNKAKLLYEARNELAMLKNAVMA